jgi:alcohol dehydrogenase (cytochrome c)/quinohemoprotein ethanol dehydrogenase
MRRNSNRQLSEGWAVNSVRMSVMRLLAAAAVSCVLLGCSRTSTVAATAAAGAVTDERLRNAASEPGQWLTYGGTQDEQRFSRLTAIDKDNVAQLGLAWFADYDTNLQQEGSPLYVDGVLYVSTAWSKVYALDAATGKQLWQYNPKVPGEWAVNVCCGLVNRGLAAYEGRIYVGTLDGRLVALDAATGKEAWSVNTIDKDWRYSITGAPRIVKSRVLIGNAGAEFGVRGYVTAYDAATGEQAWRFYTIPGEPAKGFETPELEKAAASWTGEWWKYGGGGTVWDSIVYDPVTDLLYLGVGNGSPWSHEYRSPKGGDNLFLSSIVAVQPDTGQYVWHYQTTPADNWDFTATQPIMVADLALAGTPRRVVMQAPKNGFFYVLDAKTGELLKADKYTDINWATHVDLATGRPVEVKGARYTKDKPFNMLPGPQGAHAWHAMAYSPDAGLVYIPVQEATFPFVYDPKWEYRKVGYNLGVDLGAPAYYYRDNPGEQNKFQSYIKAWDPVAAKEVWRGEMNQGPTGGALATAGGLVFSGGGTSNQFRAYDAKTGKTLWSFEAQTAIVAPPISYESNGTQYVAISVGGNQAAGYYAPNYSRLLVFALGARATLPPVQAYTPPPLSPPAEAQPAELVSAGRQGYSQYCAACHGENGQTRGATFPDLTRSPLLHVQEGFDQVVLQGARAERGMVSFAATLKPADTVALRAFLIDRAQRLQKTGVGGPPVAASQPHEER